MSDDPTNSVEPEVGAAPHPYQWAVDGPPLGTWRTFEGTFSNVMAAELTFNPDGTGTVLRQSGLFGDEVTPMLWRHNEPGELWIALVFDDEPEAPDDGDTFRYTASHRQTDAGSSPVLMNETLAGEPGGWIPAGGFWVLEGPVALASIS